jgi:hypothetical protein
MDVPSERRRHTRVRLDGRMVGRATVLAEFRIVALSESGASLEMGMPMALGSQCDLTLSLSHVAVDLKGHVVHVEAAPGTQGLYLVGVDFREVQAVDQGLLMSFLERERRRSL